MDIKLINIGFGNIVSANRVVAIVSPESAPIKRIISDAREHGKLPGEVETAMLSPGTDKIVEKLPMQRLGQPKEVAAVIWFLCSDQSSYISGAEIGVNGAQHV